MFRTTPLQLGEAVYVLGFPYAGALDNGVNFTNGLVSSVAKPARGHGTRSVLG